MNNLRTKIKIFKVEVSNFIFLTFRSLANLYLAFNLSRYSNPLLLLALINFFSEGLFIILTLLVSKGDLKFTRFKKDFALNYLRDTKPFILTSILTIIAGNIGNIILDLNFGHKSLAYFFIANNYIIAPLLLISTSIQTLFLAIYSQLFEKKDIDSIIDITHKVENFSSILFLSVIVIILLNGELILSIFLHNYMEAYPILVIMIFIPFLNGTANPYAMNLTPGKKQRLNATLIFFLYCVKIILIIILIPQFGALGFAIAMLLSSILGTVTWRYFSYKIFKIPSQIRIIPQFLLAIFTFLISFFFKEYIFQKLIFVDSIIILFLSTFFALIIFFGQILVFKQLRKEDIKFMIELLKFRNYKKSIIEEFL